MLKNSVQKTFDIEFLQQEQGTVIQKRGRNFFELVYIRSGSGFRTDNEQIFNYQHDQLFIIAPQDRYVFEVEKTTEFFFVRFDDVYIMDSLVYSPNVRHLEMNLGKTGRGPAPVQIDEKELPLLRLLIDSILKEDGYQKLFKNDVLTHMMNTLIVLVARNIASALPARVSSNSCSETKTLNILQYIQDNIYYPDKLRAKTIALDFGISVYYVGRYFKKHTNETLQQYIINYKIKMIENRLLYSDLRINQIATELGFTDESHLINLFRKYRGISPRYFREQARWL